MLSGIRTRLASFFNRVPPKAEKLNWADLIKVIARPELAIRAQRSPALAGKYDSFMAVLAEPPSAELARALGERSAEFLAALASDVGEPPPATADDAFRLLERESKLGAKDATFLGDVLSMEFFSKQFGLDFEALSAKLPGPLRQIAEQWLLIYALWLGQTYVELKYGSDFARTMMARAVQKFEEAEEFVPEYPIAEAVYVGLRRLKQAWTFFKKGSKGMLGDELAGILTEGFPFELVAATAFLTHHPSSPYLGTSTIPDNVDTELATAFGAVRSKTRPWIEARMGKLPSNEESAREIRKKADQNDAEAQVALGRLYVTGKGVPQDEAEALKWFRRAADQGNAQAQASLGGMFYNRQDYAEALKWARLAADQGNAEAQTLLGFMYANGAGVPQDYFEALEWSRKAANQGNAEAQCHLGFLYANGYGVEWPDEAIALKWFRKAADQGHAEAQSALKTMSEAALSEAAQQENADALKWYCVKKAADQGDAEAETALDTMSAAGKVPQSYGQSVRWHRKAAEQGDTDAQALLGYMYQHGKDVPQDYDEAVNWYRKAADQGDPLAQFTLGGLFLKGEGVPQNYDEAVTWFRRAADQGDVAGQMSLGVMYQEGYGVVKDYILAHMWFSLAAKQNHEDAAELRDKLVPLMTPLQIAEAQRLAREWRPK